MNYPTYTGYTPWYQQEPQSSGINWVQGEAGAKGYPVAPGQSVLLMDSESNVFYIKSTDKSGMPMPLRVFEYTERAAKKETQASDFVTRDELEKRLAEIINGKQSVSATEQQ